MPTHALLAQIPDRFTERAPDLGPIYVETPTDLSNFTGVAEPYNTATAALFIAIPVVWLYILRGRFRDYPMLTCCLPILLCGGIGGTLYHGTRSWSVYFFLDVIPIYLLGMIVSIFLWFRVGTKWSQLFGVIATISLLQMLGHWQLPKHWAINLSYAFLGAVIVMPIFIALYKTQFRDVGWIATALVSFAIALFFRAADNAFWPPVLPMGTHWLWHTFGAATTLALSVYLYRIERVRFYAT
jgi:hypothetical protein